MHLNKTIALALIAAAPLSLGAGAQAATTTTVSKVAFDPAHDVAGYHGQTRIPLDRLPSWMKSNADLISTTITKTDTAFVVVFKVRDLVRPPAEAAGSDAGIAFTTKGKTFHALAMRDSRMSGGWIERADGADIATVSASSSLRDNTLRVRIPASFIGSSVTFTWARTWSGDSASGKNAMDGDRFAEPLTFTGFGG